MAEDRILRSGRSLAACLLLVISGCGGGDDDHASTPIDASVFDRVQFTDTSNSPDRSEHDSLPSSNQDEHDEAVGPVEDATVVIGDTATDSRIDDSGHADAGDQADAGDGDAGDGAVPPTASATIQAVRYAADNMPEGGVLAVSIPVHDVYVTYLRPEIAGEINDPPGFFVQADLLGPALFIRVDPASLAAAPRVGDLVQFTVTGAGLDAGGVHQAISITNWAVESNGHSLAPLVQNLSAVADLVTSVDGYESELSTVTGVVSSNLASSAPAYLEASLSTAGLPGPSGSPTMRIPTTLRDALDITNGCQVAIGPTPLWKFKSVSVIHAEPSAWVNADINVTGCPAPRVLSASALDNTHVVVNFDRYVKASSLLANGSQFTFDGLLSLGAVLSAPNQVTITTSSQISTANTVTAAASLTDTRDQGIDSNHNSALFIDATVPAKLIINEFNANISSGSDLVELKVVQGGNVSGFKLYQDFTSAKRQLLTTLPSNLLLSTGDFILVHCNPPVGPSDAGPTPITSEFNIGNTSGNPKTDCTNATCVSTAWDIAGTTTTSLAMTRHLISLADGNDVVQDAVVYSAHAGGGIGNGLELQAAIDGNFWAGPCLSAPATPVSCGDDVSVSAAPFDSIAYNVQAPALSTILSGNSAQRMNAQQPSSASDWMTKSATWGVDNN